ncbi:hypothetical protein [Luteolibacter luteus]|uniref:Tetratricopeptide repeat protein n=1 Tax=Luteolibacter luteus TaxID=2728835 RepID=A0A858RB59_9BACT|nr:hypothetical protein [Luteolibacter luteus]QJE94226.1 hypothetical protein HHL09_13705 [Luteolibacter luteus]
MASSIRQSALTFRLSCWVLGMIAFGQLLAAGVGVAVRAERAQEVRVEEKVVTKIVTVAAPVPKPSEPLVAVPPTNAVALPPMPDATPLPPPRPLAAPAIVDPVVERLVNEARASRVAGDMGAAMAKLEDAKARAPEDPSVLYEFGLTFEQMAAVDPRLADSAADAYQAVFSLGTTGAGALYPLAAQKLRDGIEMPDAKRGELRLGYIRDFKDEQYAEGQRVLLDVPVQMAPGAEIDPKDLVVKVTFFDSTTKAGKKEILPAADGLSQTNYEWVSGEFDFLGGEETLRVTYLLPSQEAQQDHFFGKRTYYGQVVDLYYKEELIDSVASPRHLASRGSAQQQQQPQDPMEPQFLSPSDIEYGGVLPAYPGDLPNLPIEQDPNGAIPALPQR